MKKVASFVTDSSFDVKMSVDTFKDGRECVVVATVAGREVSSQRFASRAEAAEAATKLVEKLFK